MSRTLLPKKLRRSTFHAKAAPQPNSRIHWYGAATRPAHGGHAAQTFLRGKFIHHDRSKYMPHQGAQECARRAQRLGAV